MFLEVGTRWNKLLRELTFFYAEKATGFSPDEKIALALYNG